MDIKKFKEGLVFSKDLKESRFTFLRQFVKHNFEEIFGNYSKPIQTSRYTVSVAEKA